MRIDGSGNVGMGTTTPETKLHVFRSGSIAHPLLLERNSANSNIGVQFRNSAVSLYAGQLATGNFSVGPNANLTLNNLQVTPNGELMVATTTLPTGYKMAVKGNLIAEKIVVKNSTNWPDFVFKKEYKLPSLTDVENFIAQNSHLPEIPSANEIETNGQDLGEMNRLLLKKVEELTLYMIEMKKENESLKGRVKKLENK